MKIVHHRRLGCNLVTLECFGKYARGLRPENMVTMSALLMGEMIENPLGLDRLTFNHGSILYLFEFQYSSTVRTDLSWVDRDDLVGCLLGVGLSPMALVTWTGTPLMISVFLIGIGFKGELGGGGGGAKDSLLIFPFLIAQLCF